MSDLISRTKIRNHIKEQINPYGKPFEGTVYEFGLKLMDYIDNMLDAYNVDAVVEEMERERQRMEKIFDLEAEECCRGAAEAMKDAIKIVRKGGVE